MATIEPEITPLIRVLRDQRVILDADLAAIYGIPTFRFNRAFSRNRDRFPAEFAFQLTAHEFAELKHSQSLTVKSQAIDYSCIISRSSQIGMSSFKLRGGRYRPWVFTEHGALMVANILRSPRAREMSVFIIRAFVRMREELASNAAILKRLDEIDRTLLVHDSALRDVYQKLLPLLEPASVPPKPAIGFHRDDH